MTTDGHRCADSQEKTEETEGSAGDSPAPVGDPPTGTQAAPARSRLSESVEGRSAAPSGESPGGIGQWPVPPRLHCPLQERHHPASPKNPHFLERSHPKSPLCR